jgi:uncharacterized protein (TIGR00661 family)
MKILYAVQATGNGHIARAIELLPFLQQYGEVDVFLSGSNCSLQSNLPVKYRSKGLSLFYGKRGKLKYTKIASHLAPLRILKEAKQLPVEKYDIVLNDFESITSLACKLKQIPSVHFGHQASFASNKIPKPTGKDIMGELVLKNYASSKHYVGLHFKNYDANIYAPIIKQSILQAEPSNNGHITIYLGHYNDEVVVNQLLGIKGQRFHLFSKQVRQETKVGNVLIKPISNNDFSKSMITSAGVITGAGFETPAEALYLGKKLMCLPIQGQYEQLCNAAALVYFDVPIIQKIDKQFSTHIHHWLNGSQPKPLTLSHNTESIVSIAVHKAIQARNENSAAPFDLNNLLSPTDVVMPLSYSL